MEVKHAERRPSSQAAIRYHSPTGSEIAAIMRGSEDQECGRRDEVLRVTAEHER